ncbi:hypothetical protein [Spirosoma validum]|uniref:Uncharacterized protein n=1 Tax=Spirosoma validum TaxID=2771355 RepID=A0A927AX25_9BACT|nr:hypothetical protein [Spirosoma validum]MBD2751366.1 hypothetical protein [Spirosoma validum]
MDLFIDKSLVKEALRELIREEPETFRLLFKEILNEESIQSENTFEKLIQRNFRRFDATFKALA